MKIYFLIWILFLYKNDLNKNEIYKELLHISRDTKFDIFYLKDTNKHKYLKEFDVKDLYNISLKPKKSFEVFENFDIRTFPDSILWLCFVIPKGNKINLKIYSENRTELVNKVYEKTSIFKIVPKESSKIKILFTSKSKKKFNFISGYDCTYCKKNKILSKNEHIQNTKDTLTKIHKEASVIYLNHEDLKLNQIDHLYQIKKINSKVYIYTIAEFFLIIIINLFQIYSLKNLLGSKTLV